MEAFDRAKNLDKIEDLNRMKGFDGADSFNKTERPKRTKDPSCLSKLPKTGKILFNEFDSAI